MSKKEAKSRVEKLKKLIGKHRYLYHVKDTQDISDDAFDALKHELFLLEQHYPELVTPDSPTQRVGGKPLAKFSKAEHATPMLSIEDVFSKEEFSSWEEYLLRLSGQKNIEYFAEVKIDGFAVSLRYEKGVFKRGATRGNGRVGEDVTQNLKTIESIPLRLTKDVTLEVRGEVYMEKKDFEKFNAQRKKQGQEPYANPRNLAAGSIRQLDSRLAAQRPLKFMAYDVISTLPEATHAKEHDTLAKLGFRTDPTARVRKGPEAVFSHFAETEKKRSALPFHIDGVVVLVNDNKLFSELGVAGKSPRGIRALKFSGKQAATKIVDVKFQVGRTGVITPVALLEPVRLAGVMVSKATLHNEDEIKRLGVRIGDTVVVERAGDVIPAVVKALPELRSGREKAILMPKACPVCGLKLGRRKGEAAWRCGNKGCLAQKRRSLHHFTSKRAFDIVGLGPKIIDKLGDSHILSEFSDIFKITEEDLLPLEGFGQKAAKNTVSAIHQAKKIPLDRFIYALGIRHVGEETALDLAEHFLSVNNLKKATKEELEALSDIGGVVAESIHDWFRDKANLALLERLNEAGVVVRGPARGAYSVIPEIKGKTFVLTGTLPGLTREAVKERIRLSGGNVSDSVSSKTDYIVVGESPGSKLQDAKRHGVKELDKEGFLQLLKN